MYHFFFKAKIYATDDLIFKSRVLHLERYMCIKKKGEVVLTNFKLAVKILLKNKNSLKKKKQQIMHAILKYETFEILIGYSYF